MPRARPRRILILGDSLAFHRARDGQRLEECWPWLLKAQLRTADIWVRSEPAGLIHRTLAQVRLFGSSLDLFDMVIVQAGITDSCPRPIPYWLHLFLGRLGDGWLQRFVNRHYRLLLRARRQTWTSEDKFRTTLVQILEAVTPTSTLVFVPIVRPCKKLAAKAPGAAVTAERYNTIIRTVTETYGSGSARVLDDFAAACSADFVLDDGHHLNAAGHRLLADQLALCLAQTPRLAIAA